MKLRYLIRFASVALLAASVAAPAAAGGRGNGGQGARQRLRDGSCLQAQTASQSQTRARSGAQDRTQTRQRLRDGSCLPAPAPAN